MSVIDTSEIYLEMNKCAVIYVCTFVIINDFVVPAQRTIYMEGYYILILRDNIYINSSTAVINNNDFILNTK